MDLRTVVVFHNHGDFWFSRFLQPGFRHVFICVRDGGQWIRIDGMRGLPEVAVLTDFDIYCSEPGFEVLEVNAYRAERPLFLMAGTCVGLVKAVLGVRAFNVLTPYQLYKYLKRSVKHGFIVRRC